MLWSVVVGNAVLTGASGATIETVEDFCYLGSYISTTGNCDQEVNVRIGKAAGVFSKLDKLWKSKKISRSEEHTSELQSR